MHFPHFRLVDRIKTKTVMSGITYFGLIGLRMIKQKISNSNNIIDDKYSDMNDEKKIIDRFHLLYTKKNKQTFDNTYWMGVRSMKCPFDLWIFQEIISETKPDIIIETGTNEGGTSLFLANICDILNNGEIISIDIASTENHPSHNRIHYLQGNTVSDDTIQQIKKLMDEINQKQNRKVMVILDDAHDEKHVSKELEIYRKFVTNGQYLIVEDTSMGGHPVYPELGLGPMEAVKKFFNENDDFVIDTSREKFLLTFNPDGFLKKIK